MNTGLIVTMGLVAVGTAVCEKICEALGKSDMASWIRVGGTSLVGATAISLAIKLIQMIPR